MARYVDGYVMPILKKNIPAYAAIARKSGKIWRDHGALEYRECIGEDFSLECMVPFPKALKLRRGETVVFAWVVFKSRRHRDQVNAKVMSDPRMNAIAGSKKLPFDMTRIVYGGFDVIVEA